MPQDQEIAELFADAREQVLYLQELGVGKLSVELPVVGTLPARLPAKDARSGGSLDSEGSAARLEAVGGAKRQIESTPGGLEIRPPARAGGADDMTSTNSPQPKSRLASLPSLSNRRHSPRPAVVTATETENPKPKAADESLFGDIRPTLGETADTIESIQAEIGQNCTRCSLSQHGRKQVVNSTGNFNADLMFVGEAPGGDEDELGFPFVGRAGQLLTKIIEGIGLKREDVFIGNINRCRPPGNRAPEPDETAACRPFILREVAVVKPKVIVVLGATAAHNLLQVKTPISKLRGSFHDYFGVKVMPTFHPAYLLRDPHKKREVWEDMKKVRDLLNSE